MIEGVKITPLRQILDERGKVMHMLRNNDAHFQSFGEIYFSCVYPGAIKAWHLHKEMTLNYAVPHGEIKLVLYDNREESGTQGEIQEIFLTHPREFPRFLRKDFSHDLITSQSSLFQQLPDIVKLI